MSVISPIKVIELWTVEPQFHDVDCDSAVAAFAR